MGNVRKSFAFSKLNENLTKTGKNLIILNYDFTTFSKNFQYDVTLSVKINSRRIIFEVRRPLLPQTLL